MREVKFKNRKANHSLMIKGKKIRFQDGVAEVSESDAEAIQGLNDPDYKLVPIKKETKKILKMKDPDPEIVTEKKKPKKTKTGNKKKSKK